MLRQVGIGSSRCLLRKTTTTTRYFSKQNNGSKVKGLLVKEQGMSRTGGYKNTLKDRKKPEWLNEPMEDPAFASATGGGGYQLDKIVGSSSGMMNKFLPDKEKLKTTALVLVGILGLGQLSLGYAEDFFDYRFRIQNVDPDDLADFFGTEAAMDAFSVFPFVSSFLMRRGEWDDEGTYRVPILLGDYLSARMEFEEREQNLKELTPQQEWEKFMTKSIKPGEDDDDDDDDEDEDDEDEDDDEEDDEEGGGDEEEEEEGVAEEGGGGGDDEEEEEGEKEVTEEEEEGEEDEEKVEEKEEEVPDIVLAVEDLPPITRAPTVLTRKGTLALKKQGTLGKPATTSKGGLWVWVKSRFGKRQEVLSVALDVSEVKEKGTKALKRKATTATTEEDNDEIIIEGDDEDDDEEFDDEDDEEEEEDDGPKMEFFVKKETLRFVESHIKKSLFHYELEMGFNLIPETNECEVFFRGTKFRGLFPLRIVFEVHALYFIWAMEKYFNSSQFSTASDLPEEAEHYRLNIPAAAVKDYLYDLIKDVEHSRKVALANQASTKEHEQNIQEIQALLQSAGYMGAEAVLVKADDDSGKQQIMLNISDKKAKAIIQRAHTLNLQRTGTTSAVAGAQLARKMTMRIDEKKANASAIAAAAATVDGATASTAV